MNLTPKELAPCKISHICLCAFNYFGKIIFFQLRKNRVNNCFKPLVLSIFTTVASRLKSDQKEKEKEILKLNTTFSIQ